MIDKILKFLSGKKTIIASLITTTAAFLGTLGVIGPDTVTYIITIVGIIFGTASLMTNNAYKTGKIK